MDKLRPNHQDIHKSFQPMAMNKSEHVIYHLPDITYINLVESAVCIVELIIFTNWSN